MLKLYFRLVLFVVTGIITFGVALPRLISARDTLSVVLGLGVMILLLPLMSLQGSLVVKNFKEVMGPKK